MTIEEKKLRNREAQRRWVERNKEKAKEQNRLKQERWREKHTEKNLEKVVQWMKENPILSRAMYLIQDYKRADKEHNRGECTLTAQWIVDNIFPNTCHYCGKKGWEIMGCDRINNDLPHTPENVVPCCAECNRKRHTKLYEEFLAETT